MGIHARVPDHLRSSTHDRMELRLGDREAPATCKANSQKPASKQHATQELASQDANGEHMHPLKCTALYATIYMRTVP